MKFGGMIGHDPRKNRLDFEARARTRARAKRANIYIYIYTGSTIHKAMGKTLEMDKPKGNLRNRYEPLLVSK